MECSSGLGNYFDDEAAGICRRLTTKTSTPDRREDSGQETRWHQAARGGP
jgi:hypothetical protein